MGNTPTLKPIPSALIAGAIVFGAVQFFQVIPLERELAKAASGSESVKLSAEYQALNERYLQEKARSEMAMKEVASFSKVRAKKKELEIEVREYEAGYNDYKDGYEELKSRYEKLQTNLSFTQDLNVLKDSKEKVEIILACMTHGCESPFYAKYNKKYNEVAYEQFKYQLKETNDKIRTIYNKFDNCIQ
ncbi:MAG: hypothetical protein K6L73_14380 [Cellvibrionaceae bacterium]